MLKSVFDKMIAFFALIVLLPLLLLCWIITCFDTNSSGLFLQKRVGQYGKLFTIYKFRTMHVKTNHISSYGKFLRYFKIDEFPQFINILLGNMSLVGPRPDIEGYYNTLQGEARKILLLKPGLTSEAALKYCNEELLLKKQADPLKYNDEVIFPDKVKLNLDYYYYRSFLGDLKIIWKTVGVLLK
jgi:lipopolysaccharide/colanic/teichoic acid biosynthesis glycosyltransferase